VLKYTAILAENLEEIKKHCLFNNTFFYNVHTVELKSGGFAFTISLAFELEIKNWRLKYRFKCDAGIYKKLARINSIQQCA
jgi:hypothetical protein